MINFPDSIEEAYKRSKPHIRKTPLEHSPYLSNLINGNVYLKLDKIQKTGSFKFRGAVSKMTSLSEKSKRPSMTSRSQKSYRPSICAQK